MEDATNLESPPVRTNTPSTPDAHTKLTPSTLTPSDRLRAFQNSALHFLSNASNETLGACAVGLAASTYLALGRLGLVLIGAVGGIVLHAHWEAQGGYTASEGQDAEQENARKKKELGVEVVKRVLDWRDRAQDAADRETIAILPNGEKNIDAELSKSLDYSDLPPETKIAVEGLTDAIIRDYVKWWYSPLLPKEQSFPSACREVLTRFILTFSNHLRRKRPADPVLDFFANSTSIIIVFFNELGTALKASQRQDAPDAIRTYLQFQPDSSLANVLNPEQQERKLTLVSDDILQNFLDLPSYNCPPVKAFLREVLSGLILQPLIISCSQPEWINGWIVYLLEDGEPELLNVIDAGVEDMNEAVKKTPGSNQDPKHKRRVSRAEEAMQQAMQEAERLNAMIAEDEARKKRELTATESDDTLSTSMTEPGIATPTSSDSEKKRRSTRSSFYLDSEGNAIPSAQPSPSKEPESAFTTFDQLGDSMQAATLTPTETVTITPLTLHNAFVTLIDMGEGNDRVALKKEPEDEYLVQIEPASSRYPGWMITRRYFDFWKLHNSISTIARISGYPEFNLAYPVVPTWKGLTRPALKSSLEVYLRDALKHERLAESESMKKFLEKETGIAKAPAQSKNILVQGGAALENVGKNFVNVLGQSSKGIAGGGKAVLGGVQGVFGAVATGVGAPKKSTPSRAALTPSRSGTASSITPSRLSQEVSRTSSDLREPRNPPLPARPVRMDSERSELSQLSSRDSSPSRRSRELLNLPPPPEEMTDAYEPVPTMTADKPSRPTSTRNSSRPQTPTSSSFPVTDSPPLPIEPPKSTRKNAPINDEETRVMIDLMFAIITELYSLSSAWTIRLSLLTAAKSFLLRPANPQLDSIRALLQESVLDANFSDKGLAMHINKLRENSVPTEEEMATWPAPLSAEEKEKLRIKARKLLVERGMPAALTGVMGMAASGEALGKVFDCLQIQEVAKGLIFALLLQGIRAATQ